MRLPTGRFFWGIFLAAVGILWLLNNVGVTAFSLGDILSRFWPVIPIYFGVAGIADVALRGTEHRGILWGSLIVNTLATVFFAILLGNINHWFSVDLSLIWKLAFPLLLLAAGLFMLRGYASAPGARTYWAVMSGAKDVRTTWDDLSVIGFMGGADVDLSQAGLPDREVLIDIYAMMGGVEIKVPEGVSVEYEWTGVMGGMEVFGKTTGGVIDHRRSVAGQGPKVRVRAHTMMGAAKIKQVPAVFTGVSAS
ncbi:MAG TPA: LiaF domain-containing protein [Symbiobacteriaceae bacterium]|nr:LiaF domain-containing protein [Symbiobacteriaceae bacterium]